MSHHFEDLVLSATVCVAMALNRTPRVGVWKYNVGHCLGSTLVPRGYAREAAIERQRKTLRTGEPQPTEGGCVLVAWT